MSCLTGAALLAAGFGASGVEPAPVPADLPAVVLSAPVNATWAANHTEFWREKGFSGFILSGIADDLEQDLWAVDGIPETAGREDSLLLEVRFAVERLAAAGLDRNFVRVAVAPEKPYFANRAAASRALSAIDAAVQFSRLAKTRGIALDLRAAPVIYDLRWGQYDLRQTPAETLESNATEFGRQIAAKVSDGMAPGELLLLTDDPVEWRPLLLSTFEGLCKGLAGAPEWRLHVLVRSVHEDLEPAACRRLAGQANRMLSAHRSREAGAWWRKSGDVGLGLEPIGFAEDTDSPVALDSPEAFRTKAAAARLFSGAYVWVEAGPNTWWHLSPQEADTYGALLQNGSAAKSQTGPALGNLDEYTFSSPLSGYWRAGSMDALGARVEVLSGKDGAGLVFLEGSREALRIENRSAPVHVTDLRSLEKKTITPADGAADLGPFEGPTFVEDLPVRDWVVPAALWFAPHDVPRGNIVSMPVAYGWSNRSALSFTGTLEALAPERFSLIPSTQTLDLAPGQAARVDGALRGRAERGSGLVARLVLASPGGAPSSRTFRIDVPPELLWQATLDGPVEAAPMVVDLDGDGAAEIVVASRFGDVLCLDGSGRERWHERFGDSFTTSPAAGRHWSGNTVTALAGDGHLRFFDSDGRVCCSVPLGSRASACGVRFANLHPFPGDEVVTASPDGRVNAYLSNGQGLWSERVSGPVVDFDTLDIDENGRDECIVLANGAKSQMTALDGDGRTLWRRNASLASRCPLLVADLYGDWTWTVVAGFDDGRLLCLNAADAATRAEGILPNAGPILGLACADLLPSDGQEILAATAQRLYCISTALNLLWEAALPLSAAPAVATLERGPVVLAPTVEGELVCLSADGKELWRERRAAGPIRAAPVVVPRSGTEETVCIYVSGDRFIRAIQLPD